MTAVLLVAALVAAESVQLVIAWADARSDTHLADLLTQKEGRHG